MAIDFPNSPTLNQIYTVGSRSWIWDGSTWNIYANVPNRYIQDAPPSSPQSGDQWFESDTGRLFVYYDSVWVEIGNATDIAGALQPGQVTALSAVTSLTTDDVFPVVDNPSSATAANKITYGNLVTAMSASLAPGLVLVKTQAVGSGVSSVTVTDAFSSSYDSYRIIYTNGSASANGDMRMTLQSPSSGSYYSSIIYSSYAGASGATSGNGLAYWNVGSHRTVGNSVDINIHNPYLGDETWFGGPYVGVQAGSVAGHVGGYHDLGLSYTQFTLTPSSGTLTGGTIRLYGYRN